MGCRIFISSNSSRIKELINEAGLEYVTSYDAFTKNAVRNDSERIYVIAREKGKKVN